MRKPGNLPGREKKRSQGVGKLHPHGEGTAQRETMRGQRDGKPQRAHVIEDAPSGQHISAIRHSEHPGDARGAHRQAHRPQQSHRVEKRARAAKPKVGFEKARRGSVHLPRLQQPDAQPSERRRDRDAARGEHERKGGVSKQRISGEAKKKRHFRQSRPVGRETRDRTAERLSQHEERAQLPNQRSRGGG